jgi:hypothetical protein
LISIGIFYRNIGEEGSAPGDQRGLCASGARKAKQFNCPELEPRRSARITLCTPAGKDSNPHDSTGVKLLMSEHAFFEYRALLMSTPHVEEKGEPVHCLIKMEIASQDGRLRRGAELEQEAGDLILFLTNPGPHRRISHSSICKADERRLHELGPATDFNRVGTSEVHFYAS